MRKLYALAAAAVLIALGGYSAPREGLNVVEMVRGRAYAVQKFSPRYGYWDALTRAEVGRWGVAMRPHPYLTETYRYSWLAAPGDTAGNAFPTATGFGAEAGVVCRDSVVNGSWSLKVWSDFGRDSTTQPSWGDIVEDSITDGAWDWVLFDGGFYGPVYDLETVHYSANGGPSMTADCTVLTGTRGQGDGTTVAWDTLGTDVGDSTANLVMTIGPANDVVVRNIRIASGKSNNPGVADALDINGPSRRVYVREVTVRWGNDEVFSINNTGSTPNALFTVEKSVVGPGLRPHSTCSKFGDQVAPSQGVDSLTLYFTFYNNCAQRLPKLQHVDYFENVHQFAYNWKGGGPGDYDINGDSVGSPPRRRQYDLIHSEHRCGPWTTCSFRNGTMFHIAHPDSVTFDLFFVGNLGPFVGSGEAQDSMISTHSTGWGAGDGVSVTSVLPDSAFARTSRISDGWTWQPDTFNVDTTVARILTRREVGLYQTLVCQATSWQNVQDAVDSLILAEAVDTTGNASDATQDDPLDWGGFPQYAEGTPCTDGDGDGMPQAAENNYGLDDTDATDNVSDTDGDGYLAIEEVLSGYDPTVFTNPDGTEGGGGGSAPTAPSGLTAIQGSPDDSTTADLSWTDNSGDEDYFKVFRCAGSGCSPSTEADSLPANTTSDTDTGLTPGQTYTYDVDACNAVGCNTSGTAEVTMAGGGGGGQTPTTTDPASMWWYWVRIDTSSVQVVEGDTTFVRLKVDTLNWTAGEMGFWVLRTGGQDSSVVCANDSIPGLTPLTISKADSILQAMAESIADTVAFKSACDASGIVLLVPERPPSPVLAALPEPADREGPRVARPERYAWRRAA